jgi:hypothetical protein
MNNRKRLQIVNFRHRSTKRLRPRKLRGIWTLESVPDLIRWHGINLVDELANIFQEEILKELEAQGTVIDKNVPLIDQIWSIS